MRVVHLPGTPLRRPAAAGSRYRPPRLIDPVVPRPALVQRLAGVRGGIVLLAAPAGSGKTLLLATHHARLQADGARVGWLTLSPQDNDPQALRRHLAQAFALDASAAGDTDADLPDAPAGLDGFIDGLDHLREPAAQALLESFVLGLPADSRFHLATRQPWGALLHDGRLRGIVDVVGAHELRMDDAEAAALLGEGWSAAEAAQLNRLVDGWPAGLRFLAREPAASQRLLDAPDDATPLPTAMADYLDDALATGTAPALLAQLMELAVLDRFTPRLLAAVPDACCGWEEVEEHLRRGLFMRHADDARDWVRIQPALGRHLRQRLRRLQPARYDSLRRFAAAWFGEHGFTAEAIRHAVAIAETPLAARIIEQAGAITVDIADGPDVRLGADIPPERAGELPLVFMGQIYWRIRHGRPQEALVAFRQAQAATQGFTALHPDADAASTRIWALMMEMLFQSIEDLPVTDAQVALLETELRAHLGAQSVLAASIASVLAFAYLDLSRYADAATICNLGLHAQRTDNEHKVTVFLRIHQASAALARDTLATATLCIEDAQRLARIEGGSGSYEVLTSQMMRAVLHYENNEPEAAWRLLQPALDQVRVINGWVRLQAEAFAIGAATAAQLGGLEAAEAVIRAGEDYARERKLPRLACFMAITRLRELTRAGEWRAARSLLESQPLAGLIASDSLEPYVLVQQVPALLEAAHLMLGLGRPRDALALLDRINRAFLDEADSRLRLGFRVLAMRAAQGLRRYHAAIEHMQAAADIARQAGLVRRALDARAPLIEVFDGAARNGHALPGRIGAWIGQVLRPADGTGHGQTPQQDSPRRSAGPVEGNFMLSPRESEIIALMAEGYLNKEIAARLGISEGTVKTHRKKAYEKLGVSSRSQAILRARDLLII